VVEKGAKLPEKVLGSIERNALLNAARHEGKAQVGPVVSKVIGEFPDLKTKARDVAQAVQNKVREVNSMAIARQKAILQERYPEAEREPEKRPGRVGLPALPGAVKGAVVLRLPPEPSGFMTIGHAMAFTINYVYKEMYAGRLWLRFEDTNPRKVEKHYYESFRDGTRWLGIKWDYEKNVSSDLELIYDYGQKLLEEGNAYACGCDEAKVKRLRFAGEACEHREHSFQENLAIWEEMRSRRYGEGKYVVRLKGDMRSLDTSMRDPNIFRVVNHPHPLTGSRFVVWPTYDLEVVVEDELCKITHVLRSSEFHLELQALIRRLLSFHPVTTLQFSRFNFKGTPVSKRLLRPLVEKKLVGGWDDPRMPTIDGIKRRGILSQSIRDFTLQVGYTKSEHEYDWSLLFAVNRKLLDPTAKRLYFVPQPATLRVREAPRKRVTIPFHPDRDLGERELSVKDKFLIPSPDLSAMEEGETFRLMELYNVKLLKKGGREARGEYVTEDLIVGTKKVQWTTDSGKKIRVLEPGLLYPEDEKFDEKSLRFTEGTVEEAFDSIKIGEIVQFPRFGFCRRDSKDACILAHK